MRYNDSTNETGLNKVSKEKGMKNKSAKTEKVGKKEMLQELLLMLDICFEGKAIIYDGAVRMTLPSGESFTLTVDEVA